MKRPVGRVIFRPLGAVRSTFKSAILENRGYVLEMNRNATSVWLGDEERQLDFKVLEAHDLVNKANMYWGKNRTAEDCENNRNSKG